MKLIAHRGNISGPSKRENAVEHIQQSIDLGFDAEVDIRWIDGEWWLGHDNPQYKIISPLTEFDNTKVWWHCKNFAALEMLQSSGLNYFWHQEDDHTLTSNGYIWTYPGKEVGTKNVIVMPETTMEIANAKKLKCYGICSDFVLELKD